MGAFASKLRSLYRPIQNFNVEERAMKVISQEKQKAAPPHPSMKKIMEDIQNDPELMNKGRVDPKQLENLAQVFVTSKGDNATIIRKVSSLPKERHSPVDYFYGYEEPDYVRPGKITLRKILDILSKYQIDRETNSVEALAKEYKLDLLDVNNIVTYFKTFEVLTPPKELAPPERNPLRLLQQKIDNIKE